ncbi:hypothetical protein [Paenibacillus naphthalenovorans]|uniref:hypothetical protein n=2 Tax=Paenibacillus naphthalenovorans TaxID=162209 RepID=UPI0006D0E4F1|nr:hypothetical protein [Paenibacillus naphthalenovorans]GCL71756.1 hypothetical protein PN4B1_16610 [Paenibacillus naphthalenovorans]SDJ62172.1 hypothetical protein SAMN05421868_13469 [Paenibacillus naphthalenovorans]
MQTVQARRHIHHHRGDDMDKKPAEILYHGGTVIKIFAPDPMTDEERKVKMDRLEAAIWAIIDECHERGEAI